MMMTFGIMLRKEKASSSFAITVWRVKYLKNKCVCVINWKNNVFIDIKYLWQSNLKKRTKTIRKLKSVQDELYMPY